MNNISNSEWKIMNILWQKSPQTITEITHALEAETHWDRHTVITYLNRLEKKGAVRHEQGTRAKAFYPVISEKETTVSAARTFLQRAFHGDIGLMVNNMIEEEALSEKDIENLREILGKK